MKALEILKNGISFMTMHKDLNPQSREYLESEISQYEEAIKELEAPKSCDGCRFDSERQFGCYRFDDCCREHTRKERIDRYEPKDK